MKDKYQTIVGIFALIPIVLYIIGMAVFSMFYLYWRWIIVIAIALLACVGGYGVVAGGYDYPIL